MSRTASAPLYEETQELRSTWWIAAAVAVATVAAWAALVATAAGEPGATDLVVVLLVWLLAGVGLPVVLLVGRLRVVVGPEEIDVRYRPFLHRRIPLRDVASYEVRRYAPLREYGGFGVKGWSRGKVAYNVRGTWGVDLTLADGRRVLLGSQHADRLGAAVGAALEQAGRTG